MGGEATEFNSQESSGRWWGVLESRVFRARRTLLAE